MDGVLQFTKSSSPVIATDGGQDDAMIIGHNTDSRETVGVWSEVDSEEFHEAFKVGECKKTINSIDRGGVALAAIKGLSEQLDERDEHIDELEVTNPDTAETPADD